MEKHLHGRGEDRESFYRWRRLYETPPRTWRRRPGIGETTASLRNTSTDVEKTRASPSPKSPVPKHLHGRGEDQVFLLPCLLLLETPPRTWRRLVGYLVRLDVVRNTSTDVEKTCCSGEQTAHQRKHLHGRGEDCRRRRLAFVPSETPPRTWRRLVSYGRKRTGDGNTSTDVEKTKSMPSGKDRIRKHLHGRGEDYNWINFSIVIIETPPRTWRRLADYRRYHYGCRNTSTDVEKTNTTGSVVVSS